MLPRIRASEFKDVAFRPLLIRRMDGAAVVAFGAFLIAEFKARLGVAMHQHVDFPGPAVSLRVIDGGFVVDGVGAEARVALDDVQLIAVRVARRIEPGFIVEVGDIDHQGIALPMAHGIAHGEVDAVQMRAGAGGYVSDVVQVLVQEDDDAGMLEDPDRKRHVADARNAGHHAVDDGIDARALFLALEGFGAGKESRVPRQSR